MVEVIVVIVMLGILSVGTFVSLKHLFMRVTKSKAMSELSHDSQIVADQISALLYDRVSSSTIGSKNNNGSNYSSIYDLNDTYPILEWISISSEALKMGLYSGFVDLDDSNRTYIKTDTFKDSNITNLLEKKFGSGDTVNSTAIIFAGSFDDGVISDIKSSFGWHGSNHSLVYEISNVSGNSIILDKNASEIYEKFYLVDTAYAIARKADISCAKNSSDDNNTLYLFYNYRPWRGETFCEGNVTILSKEVSGFWVDMLNDTLFFRLTMQREIRGSDSNITISKEKAVF